jgi:hypothetical protein
MISAPNQKAVLLLGTGVHKLPSYRSPVRSANASRETKPDLAAAIVPKVQRLKQKRQTNCLSRLSPKRTQSPSTCSIDHFPVDTHSAGEQAGTSRARRRRGFQRLSPSHCWLSLLGSAGKVKVIGLLKQRAGGLFMYE